MNRLAGRWLVAACALFTINSVAVAQNGVSIGGFIPFVGLGMTDEYKTIDSTIDGIDVGATFFISDPAYSVPSSATQLGSGSTPYYDIALLDTGAATHIITQQAYEGFDIEGNGMAGTNIQEVGGATGVLEMLINDAGGVYIEGLQHATVSGDNLVLDKSKLRGQTSFATLAAPEEWTLPNIVGLPIATQHTIVIRNSNPQVFEYQGNTVRTPDIELTDLGTGADEGIVRRADLNIRPGIGFVQGPYYVYNTDFSDILNGGDIAFHDNPASPSVVQDQNGSGGSLFLEVDMEREGNVKEEREFLFDTGADMTVISQTMAKRLGFDAVLDTPDFYLEVEGSGGISSGVPGIFLDELSITTVGGDFTLYDVPVAILDVTDVSDPGNVLDGIIGTHLFNGRDLVIDANPSLGAGGSGPSLYISDPVTTNFTWSSSSATGSWQTAGNWAGNVAPTDYLAATYVVNATGQAQTAIVSTAAKANTVSVGGGLAGSIELAIQSGASLTTYGETRIEAGGIISVAGGARLDTQFINIEEGTLTGGGEVYVGTGPITSAVRNLSGRVEPGDGIGQLTIDGDFSNLEEATVAFELGGDTAVTGYDQLEVLRYAFLAGTLEVSLEDGFTPGVGDSFTLITAVEGITGEFDQSLLPAGYDWSVAYNANSVVLSVAAFSLVLEGDFNTDGIVDMADYVVWRNNLGNGYTLADYQVWKYNFGSTLPQTSSSIASVPEPTSAVLSLAMVAMLVAASRRKSCGDLKS